MQFVYEFEVSTWKVFRSGHLHLFNDWKTLMMEAYLAAAPRIVVEWNLEKKKSSQ